MFIAKPDTREKACQQKVTPVIPDVFESWYVLDRAQQDKVLGQWNRVQEKPDRLSNPLLSPLWHYFYMSQAVDTKNNMWHIRSV